MNSSDLHSDCTMRLLDIVYDLHGSDKGYPYQNVPFSSGDDGAITLSENLMSELSKEENKNLILWTHQNIESLF
jgi:hypothetical protein